MSDEQMSVLKEAHKIIYGDREKTYGHPSKNLNNIAVMWDVYLNGRNDTTQMLTAKDVAAMMILLKAFDDKQDVYKIMASSIYGKAQEDITPEERFVGKTTILGAGYGMGAHKFALQLKTFGVEISDEESSRIIAVYRDTYPRIPALWKEANRALDAMAEKRTSKIGVQEQAVCLTKSGFLLPSGLYLSYPSLQKDVDDQYSYANRRGRIKIYGGKVVENICQAVARCVIGEQMLKIAKRYKVALTVHDAVMAVVPEGEKQEAIKYVAECMSWRPKWAETLPLACEIGAGNSYSDCSDKKPIDKWEKEWASQ